MYRIKESYLLLFFLTFSTVFYAQESKININNLLQENKVPALGIAKLKNGKLTQLKMYGELYKGEPASIDAIFNVASLTKPIVAMLTLKLAKNGDLNLDEPVNKYWTDPDVRNDSLSHILTTRHILTHQSGFPNWRWENENKKLKFKFVPGTAFQYSGEGFEYLQKALESKFEKPLNKLADSLIFQPLGMKNSNLVWTDAIEEDRFARWHDSNGLNSYNTLKNTTSSAADNLLTTVYDYGKFAEYVLEKVSGKDLVYQDMVTQGNGPENKTVIGLGWELLPELKNDEYAILHTGSDIGVQTIIILLPETGEGLILFTNSDNGNKLYFDLIRENLSLGEEIINSAQ